MFTVYVIYSRNFNKIYIGVTSDIQKRIFAHNHLPKGWTKNFRPWEVVYSEAYQTKSEALIGEKQLKSAKGREFLRKIIASKTTK